MIWDKNTTEQLVADGNARITKRHNYMKFLREKDKTDLIAIDTPAGTFYAGQEYNEVNTNKDYDRSYQVGDYMIYTSLKGDLVRVQKVTLQ